MDEIETAQLIDLAGGDVAFAKLLGIDSGKFHQRVNNWKRRGMPSAVELEHLDLLRDLRERLGSSSRKGRNRAKDCA